MDSFTGLTSRHQLDALCWAANRAGLSYGQFCATISFSEREEVFAQYEDLLKQRKENNKRNEELRKKLQKKKKRGAR